MINNWVRVLLVTKEIFATKSLNELKNLSINQSIINSINYQISKLYIKRHQTD